MLAELAAANAAFSVIKNFVSNGKELASCGKQIGDFVFAKEQIEKKASKKRAKGIRTNDLEEFMALEQIRVKHDKLREYMQLYGRAGLWTDYQRYCSEARKARKEAALKQKKRQEEIKDLILKIVLGILITALLAGVVTVLAIIAKKKGII